MAREALLPTKEAGYTTAFDLVTSNSEVFRDSEPRVFAEVAEYVERSRRVCRKALASFWGKSEQLGRITVKYWRKETIYAG